MGKPKPIRKGNKKTFPEDNPFRLPSDRDLRVLAYDDENVIVEWQTEAPTGDGTVPVVRTATVSRKDWDDA